MNPLAHLAGTAPGLTAIFVVLPAAIAWVGMNVRDTMRRSRRAMVTGDSIYMEGGNQ